MARTPHSVKKTAIQFLLAAAVTLGAGLYANAQSVQHLSVALPGGMPGSNVVTDVILNTNGVQVTWDGPSGYYQLFESPTLEKPKWHPMGRRTNLIRTETISDQYSNSYFRVLGPAASYRGAQACKECHEPIENTYKETRHAFALTDEQFVACGGPTNSDCLACHTVGYKVRTGFVSAKRTPHLGGVQCENCHGPAGNHAANPDDVAARPRIEMAAEVCGGCHNDPQHPTFSEWTNSAHSQVVQNFNATNQIDSCGRCHSGNVRISLLEGMPLPKGDADMGVVCATCHDPHQTNSNPFQLRNPLSSTNDYFMPTNGTFASSYNPNINVCAQCHNHAGASWTNNASEPHHSLQYNMLLGTVGVLASGLAPSSPGTHALSVTNQCIGCHMQTSPYQSDALPAVTGHNFKVQSYAVCTSCHGLSPPLMAENVLFATETVSNQIQELKFDLNYWAAHAAPAALAKYGNLAWEYTTPGGLSSGGPGPNTSEQALIPVNIQKARFNVYVVLNDGSLGIHNIEYTETLLNDAEDWIAEELDQ